MLNACGRRLSSQALSTALQAHTRIINREFAQALELLVQAPQLPSWTLDLSHCLVQACHSKQVEPRSLFELYLQAHRASIQHTGDIVDPFAAWKVAVVLAQQRYWPLVFQILQMNSEHGLSPLAFLELTNIARKQFELRKINEIYGIALKQNAVLPGTAENAMFACRNLRNKSQAAEILSRVRKKHSILPSSMVMEGLFAVGLQNVPKKDLNLISYNSGAHVNPVHCVLAACFLLEWRSWPAAEMVLRPHAYNLESYHISALLASVKAQYRFSLAPYIEKYMRDLRIPLDFQSARSFFECYTRSPDYARALHFLRYQLSNNLHIDYVLASRVLERVRDRKILMDVWKHMQTFPRVSSVSVSVFCQCAIKCGRVNLAISVLDSPLARVNGKLLVSDVTILRVLYTLIKLENVQMSLDFCLRYFYNLSDKNKSVAISMFSDEDTKQELIFRLQNSSLPPPRMKSKKRKRLRAT